MLNTAEHEIYPAHNVKVPIFVGILTFISMINTILLIIVKMPKIVDIFKTCISMIKTTSERLMQVTYFAFYEQVEIFCSVELSMKIFL